MSRGTVFVPGAFNALVARAVARAGFEATYISGGATANVAGYPDIGLITLTEMARTIREISDASGLPVIADADTLPEDIGRVLTDPAEMAPFLLDWRKRHLGRARAVVQPQDTEQVARLVRWCAAHRIPIVPQGGNSGLTGGSVPDDQGRAIVLSMTRMNRIRAIDPINNTLVAEAGDEGDAMLTATFDLTELAAQRASWGVFRDRRPDLYGSLTSFDGV